MTAGTTATSRPTLVPLSRERIAAAALELLDSEGPEALTMRRLAAQLDRAPMSLYNHVRGKDDLIALVVDTALASVDTNVAGTWDERIAAIVHRSRQAMLAHPGVLPLMAHGVRIGPSIMRVQEALLTALADARLANDAVAIAYLSIVALATSPTFTGALATVPRWLDGATLEERARDHPVTRRLAGDLTSVDPDEAFEFALRIHLDGLRGMQRSRPSR